MVDTDFLTQIEASRKHLRLTRNIEYDPEETPPQNHLNSYVPPSDTKIIPCYEDINGEFVPYPAHR